VAAILIIEDDAGIRSALTRALTERGHGVHWQPAGLSGLQSVIDENPDVVLLDLGLPDVDGLQVLTMLRAVSAVPVIIITARDDDAEVVRALDSGAGASPYREGSRSLPPASNRPSIHPAKAEASGRSARDGIRTGIPPA